MFGDEIQPDVGLLNASQMLLSTEPLELFPAWCLFWREYGLFGVDDVNFYSHFSCVLRKRIINCYINFVEFVKTLDSQLVVDCSTRVYHLLPADCWLWDVTKSDGWDLLYITRTTDPSQMDCTRGTKKLQRVFKNVNTRTKVNRKQTPCWSTRRW